jgi:hypothetical protein
MINACKNKNKSKISHFPLGTYSVKESGHKIFLRWSNSLHMRCLSFWPLFMKIVQEFNELCIWISLLVCAAHGMVLWSTTAAKSHKLQKQGIIDFGDVLCLMFHCFFDVTCHRFSKFSICQFLCLFPLCWFVACMFHPASLTTASFGSISLNKDDIHPKKSNTCVQQ